MLIPRNITELPALATVNFDRSKRFFCTVSTKNQPEKYFCMAASVTKIEVLKSSLWQWPGCEVKYPMPKSQLTSERRRESADAAGCGDPVERDDVNRVCPDIIFLKSVRAARRQYQPRMSRSIHLDGDFLLPCCIAASGQILQLRVMRRSTWQWQSVKRWKCQSPNPNRTVQRMKRTAGEVSPEKVK